mgnify:CR=1 FL=1
MASTEKSSRKTYHHGDLASELLRAAERELSENGIESFSLRAVAKRAGVSHGAPAHHFRDARGLLTALAADAVVLAAFTAAKLKSDPAVVSYAVIGIAAVFVAEWIFLSGQRRETNTDSIENKVESGSGDHDRP